MDLDATALRDIADLTLALDRQRRLIGELDRAIVQQRQAVTRGDVPGVEASIRLLSTALLTLQETQRYRAMLLQRLVGDSAQPLEDLDIRFDTALPDSFLVARREVRNSATEVGEEVWRAQGVLLVTLREREAMLRELLTGSRPTSPVPWPVPIAEG
jgi:hypothetical protein